MMDYFLLYLILRLDVFSHISNVAAIVTGIIFVVTLVVYATNYNNEKDKKLPNPGL